MKSNSKLQTPMPRQTRTQMTIRAADNSDTARIAELCGELGYPTDVDAFAPRLARLFQSDADAVFVAAHRDDGVVGWIHGGEREYLECGLRCEILGLVVSNTKRRSGAGRALVDAVERWAAQRGLTEVSVRSNVVRLESHPFYERLGYLRTKTQHVYRKAIAALR